MSLLKFLVRKQHKFRFESRNSRYLSLNQTAACLYRVKIGYQTIPDVFSTS